MSGNKPDLGDLILRTPQTPNDTTIDPRIDIELQALRTILAVVVGLPPTTAKRMLMYSLAVVAEPAEPAETRAAMLPAEPEKTAETAGGTTSGR